MTGSSSSYGERSPRLNIPSPMEQQGVHILLALAERDLHGYGIQRATRLEPLVALRSE